MNAAPEYQPSLLDLLLAEAATEVTQPRWGAIVEEAVTEAKQRFADLSSSANLEERLQLVVRLIAGEFSVSSALAIIDALPDFDPLDRDRLPDPPSRRPGVQQIALAIEDAP